MRLLTGAFACLLAAGMAQVAVADDATDVQQELKAMKQRLEQQDRKIRELEGHALTQDEVDSAVSRYLGNNPGAVLVGGADAEGKAGFPMGKKPFIQQGPNKVSLIMRNQVRYEAFLYSDDAKGTLSDTGNPFSDAAPRDRSGYELERLYFGLEGTIFCENISYQFIMNFDADTGSGVEKEFAWLDWKYSKEHHVRAGVDKVPFTYEEQNSSGALAFVDRSMVTKAFALGSDTGVALWGNFGSCDCPKAFLYKFAMSTGEGSVEQAGSVFGTNAFDTYSDQLLFSGMLEWTITCKDWAFDEVDNRPCDQRCKLDLSVGVTGYYENDDDLSHLAPGALALRTSGTTLDRWGANAYVRGRWNGFSWLAQWCMRTVDYTGASAAPEQQDMGADIMVHYRFGDSNWGVGAKAGMIWIDDDYDSITVGPAGNTTVVPFNDTITEVGVVVNYFFWDHSNKITADATWVTDNSGVNSSSPGYMWGPTRGVVIEDGILLRIQWQLQF